MPKIGDINPFAEKEVPLPGKRVAVIQQENIARVWIWRQGDHAAAAAQNESWTQPGGVPATRRATWPSRRVREESLERGRRHRLDASTAG